MIGTIEEGEIRVGVALGIGASCWARLPREHACGLSAREMIRRVIDTPQECDVAARTARAVGRMLGGPHQIDTEIALDSKDPEQPGQPVLLDDVVIEGPADKRAAWPREVLIGVSQEIRGGNSCRTRSIGRP